MSDEIYTTEQAIKDIETIIKKICPGVIDLSWIKGMVEYHKEMSHAKEPIFWNRYDEYVRMEELDSLTKRLKYHLIDNNERYGSLLDYEPKNDFEDGVLNAIGLCRFIEHCMNPG